MEYSKKDRMDMSMGTKDYDKGYARGMNDRYGNPAAGKVMGHDRAPSKLNGMPMNMYSKSRCPNRGYDSKAYDYSY